MELQADTKQDLLRSEGKKSCWILIWRKCMEQKPPN